MSEAAVPLRPIAPFRPVPDLMAWERIVALFHRHGVEPPPVRLRDELVNHLCWAEYGWNCAALAALDAPPVSVTSEGQRESEAEGQAEPLNPPSKGEGA